MGAACGAARSAVCRGARSAGAGRRSADADGIRARAPVPGAFRFTLGPQALESNIQILGIQTDSNLPQIEALPLGQKDFTQSALGMLRTLMEGTAKRASLVPARVLAAAGAAGAGARGVGGGEGGVGGGGGGAGPMYSMLMDFNDNDLVRSEIVP